MDRLDGFTIYDNLHVADDVIYLIDNYRYTYIRGCYKSLPQIRSGYRDYYQGPRDFHVGY